MIPQRYLDLYLRGLLFVTLTISGNYISKTIGCEQRTLLDNRIFKQFILLFIIYNSLNYTRVGDTINPIYHIINTLFIWLIYLIFEKMSGRITLILVILLFITMITTQYKYYYETLSKNEDDYSRLINVLIVCEYIEVGLFIMILLYGLIDYRYTTDSKVKLNDFLFNTKVRC